MCLFHLHALGWNAPLGFRKVELGPLCTSQLSGSYEEVRRNLEREQSAWLTLVRIDCSKQLTDSIWFSDGRTTFRHDRCQGATQTGCDVVFTSLGHDGVPEHLSTALLGPVSGFVFT